jgi:hypothetical protein
MLNIDTIHITPELLALLSGIWSISDFWYGTVPGEAHGMVSHECFMEKQALWLQEHSHFFKGMHRSIIRFYTLLYSRNI